MRRPSLKKSIYYLFFLFFFLGTRSELFAISDTTYLYFFSYRNIPVQINLKQKIDRFELSIAANKLNATVDSSLVAKGGNAILKIRGFEPTSTASSAINLPFDVTLTQFNNAMRILLVSHTNVTDVSSADLLQLYVADVPLSDALGDVYEKIKKVNITQIVRDETEKLKEAQTEKIAQINRAHTVTIDSLLNIIDVVDEENRYGGQFELVDKDSLGIPIYIARTGKRYTSYPTHQYRFYPNSILVKTFNNFIDLLLVSGVAVIDGQPYQADFYNGEFSIPLRHIFERRQFLAFRIKNLLRYKDSTKTGLEQKTDSTKLLNTTDTAGKMSTKFSDYQTFLINISDLIRVSRYKNHFTFMIKNDSYLLTRRDSIVPFERRTFYDYLSFTTFMDFLGTVEKTPNSLIQIEGRIRLPLKLINSNALAPPKSKYLYKYVFFPRIDAYLNGAFINGSQADNRFGTILNQSTNSAELDTLFIDNFDLVRKNNIRTGIEMGIAKHEMKPYNVNFYIDYGIHFFRTNLNYTIVNNGAADEERKFSAWSWTHGPIMRAEYRPDQNLGMDLSFAANCRQMLLNSDNENLRVFEVKGPLNPNLPPQANPLNTIFNRQRQNYKLEFNAYFMINPTRSNGGLYFRLSNYFNYNFKQIFPQVLIGYSTRLSGMIKNIRNKPGTDD